MNISAVLSCIKKLLHAFDGRVMSIRCHYMGGEPLLAWDEIRRLNEMLSDTLVSMNIKYHWSLTSNLLALDKEKTEIMRTESAGIHCSFDGIKSVHDKNRPYLGGAGSFDDVVKKVPLALSISPNDTARVTVLPEDAGSIGQIAESVWQNGFKTAGIFPASLVHWPRSAIRNWGTEIASLLALHYDDHSVRTIIRNRQARDGGCRMASCGAGKSLWAIDTEGRLFTCHHFTRFPEQAVIDPINSSPSEIRTAMRNCKFGSVREEISEKCQRCPAARFCTGGCWANEFIEKEILGATYSNECLLRLSIVQSMLRSTNLLMAYEGEHAPRSEFSYNSCNRADCNGADVCYSCDECEGCEVECEFCEECHDCTECETCMGACEMECQEVED